MSRHSRRDWVRRPQVHGLAGIIGTDDAIVAQVETLLTKQDPPDKNTSKSPLQQDESMAGAGGQASAPIDLEGIDMNYGVNVAADMTFASVQNIAGPADTSQPDRSFSIGTKTKASPELPREIIGLGLEEPMPTADVVQELFVIRSIHSLQTLTMSTATTSTLRRSILRFP